jgi:hypothetical protein
MDVYLVQQEPSRLSLAQHHVLSVLLGIIQPFWVLSPHQAVLHAFPDLTLIFQLQQPAQNATLALSWVLTGQQGAACVKLDYISSILVFHNRMLAKNAQLDSLLSILVLQHVCSVAQVFTQDKKQLFVKCAPQDHLLLNLTHPSVCCASLGDILMLVPPHAQPVKPASIPPALAQTPP